MGGANTYAFPSPTHLDVGRLFGDPQPAPDAAQLDRIERKLDELLELERKRQDAADYARLTAEWHRRHR